MVNNDDGKITVRYDTAENWQNANPVLDKGEIGVENDTNIIKIGNGIDVWNNLTSTNIIASGNNEDKDKSFCMVYPYAWGETPETTSNVDKSIAVYDKDDVKCGEFTIRANGNTRRSFISLYNPFTETWSDIGLTAISDRTYAIIPTLNTTLTIEKSGECRFQGKTTNVTLGTAPSSNTTTGSLYSTDSTGTWIGAYQIQYTTGKYTRSIIYGKSPSNTSLTWHFDANSSPSFYYNQADNTCVLGTSSKRWKQVWAGTGTIQTSDERKKQKISQVDDVVLDAWENVKFCQFKFNDSVNEKGDKARFHNGVIAQQIKKAFEDVGLNAFKYGLLCYDEWKEIPAEYDDNGELLSPKTEAGNMYSVRYDECLCMEASYQRRRADKLEERIAKLEALLLKE